MMRTAGIRGQGSGVRVLGPWTIVAILACSLRALAQDPAPDQIKEWMAGLHSRYYDERDEAKRRLAEAGKAAEEPLLAALGDGDFRVRSAAIELLGKLKSAKAIPRLVDLLVDPDQGVAGEAGKALFAIGPEARAAVDARARSDAAFAEKSSWAIRLWTESDVEQALDPLMTPDGGWGFWEGQYSKVAALGKPAVAVLLAMFTDPAYEFHTIDERRQSTIRTLAGEALAEVADASFVPNLKERLDGEAKDDKGTWDKNGLEFEAAAYALWTHGEKKYLEDLEGWWKAQAQGGRAASTSARHRLAFVLIRQQKYAEAEGVYQEEIAAQPSDMSAIFNLATVYGKQGKKDLALSTLKEAVKNGYDNVDWLKRDGYLQCLRGTLEYDAIVKDLEAKNAKPEDEGKPQ